MISQGAFFAGLFVALFIFSKIFRAIAFWVFVCVILITFYAVCVEAAEDVTIQGRVHGSGDSEEVVQHIPQYMPYYPTAATIWPRTIDVNCKEVGLELECEGYNWKPEMGRTEYLFINPKIVKESVAEIPKEVPAVIVTPSPQVSKSIVKKPKVKKVYKQIKKGCSL